MEQPRPIILRKKVVVSRARGTRLVKLWDEKAIPRDVWKKAEVLPVDENTIPFLIDDDAIRAFGQLGKLQMVKEKFVDPFVRERYDLNSKFGAIHCSPLLDGSDTIFPNLVKQFYANLTIGIDKSWVRSCVKGVSFHVNSALLAEILHIPNAGICLHSPPADLPFSSVVESIFEGVVAFPKRKGFEFDASCLKDHLRIINRIACANIFPKGYHFQKVRKDVCYLIYCLEKGICCNVAQLMIRRLTEPTSFNIFFPGFLTKIFEFFGIPFDGEPREQNRSKITMENMKKMDRKGQSPAKGKEKMQEECEDTPAAKGKMAEEMSLLEIQMRYIRMSMETGFSNLAKNQEAIAKKLNVAYEPLILPDYEEFMQEWREEYHPEDDSDFHEDEDSEREEGTSHRPRTRSQKKRRAGEVL